MVTAKEQAMTQNELTKLQTEALDELATDASSTRVFTVPVEELSREEQFGVAGILKGMESIIKKRLKAIEPALREEVAEAPLTEDGTKRRIAVDNVTEVVEHQPKIEMVFDPELVRAMCEDKGIDPYAVLTPVTTYTLNEAKLESLMELGHISEDAVEACKVEKKGRKSVSIRAIGTLKNLLEGKRSSLLGNK
jgi:hypothetical protein